jgi:hypothetical protein
VGGKGGISIGHCGKGGVSIGHCGRVWSPLVIFIGHCGRAGFPLVTVIRAGSWSLRTTIGHRGKGRVGQRRGLH